MVTGDIFARVDEIRTYSLPYQLTVRPGPIKHTEAIRKGMSMVLWWHIKQITRLKYVDIKQTPMISLVVIDDKGSSLMHKLGHFGRHITFSTTTITVKCKRLSFWNDKQNTYTQRRAIGCSPISSYHTLIAARNHILYRSKAAEVLKANQ